MHARRPRGWRSSPCWTSLIVLLIASPPAEARPGDLDASFGTGGILTFPVGPGDERALGVLPDAAGGALAAGWAYNGTDRDVLLGRVTTSVGTGDDVAEALAFGVGDRPVVAGWTQHDLTTDILLMRYAGAAPDPTFGTAGIVRTPVPGGGQAFAITADGRDLVVAGRAGDDLLVARYDENGNLDPSFGVGGITVTPAGGQAAAMGVTTLGSRIVIAGWVRRGPDADVILAEYDSSGRLRSGFGNGGIVVTSLGAGDDVAEAVVGDGNRLFVAGWSRGPTGTQAVLAAYDPSGGVVGSFGTGGVVRRSVGSETRALALAVGPDNLPVAAGRATIDGVATFVVLRHLRSGAPDLTFGIDGVVTTPIGVDAAAEAVAVQRDGRILVAGHASNGTDDDIAIARYLGTPRCGNGLLEADSGETCDDGNQRPGDCCAPNCRLDPPGAACARDSDPCTDDSCDGAGACLHAPAAAACDAHLCYRAGSTVPVTPTAVAVSSVYGEGLGSARRPQAICLPAAVDGAAAGQPTLFQEAYRLRVGKLDRVSIQVSDRFGTQHLRMFGGDRLLLPTRVGSDLPPLGPPLPGAANAFQCYDVARVPRTTGPPPGLQATVTDAVATRRYELRAPERLCVPTDANGSQIPLFAEYLLCYRLRPAAGEPRSLDAGTAYTANALGAGHLHAHEARELCVPAATEPCDTLPPCVPLAGQSADCSYDPLVVNPTHPLCQGPNILVDATHANFHTVETNGVAGRYWGFARLLSHDGYVVEQSETPIEALLPRTRADVLAIANPTTDLTGGTEAVPAEEVPVIADWVRNGGALLLVIDHDPFERVGLLLAAFGLEHLPAGIVAMYTFTAASGDLVASSAVAIGPAPDTAVDEVTTFTGTAFRVAADPPPEAQFEPVLTFPPGFTGTSAGEVVDLGGYLQGVAIRFGAGRVYVSGEAGGLTAQNTFGMQFTPDNERFLRNILWWLTQ